MQQDFNAKNETFLSCSLSLKHMPVNGYMQIRFLERI